MKGDIDVREERIKIEGFHAQQVGGKDQGREGEKL